MSHLPTNSCHCDVPAPFAATPDPRRRAQGGGRAAFREAAVLAGLLALTFVFYWPNDGVLKSPYVYFADMYERSGHVWNAAYDQRFHRQAIALARDG